MYEKLKKDLSDLSKKYLRKITNQSKDRSKLKEISNRLELLAKYLKDYEKEARDIANIFMEENNIEDNNKTLEIIRKEVASFTQKAIRGN